MIAGRKNVLMLSPFLSNICRLGDHLVLATPTFIPYISNTIAHRKKLTRIGYTWQIFFATFVGRKLLLPSVYFMFRDLSEVGSWLTPRGIIFVPLRIYQHWQGRHKCDKRFLPYKVIHPIPRPKVSILNQKYRQKETLQADHSYMPIEHQ